MIHWKLTEQQADVVLNALGQRPFLEVQGLIGVLMTQAQEQQQRASPLLDSQTGSGGDAGLPVQHINGAAVS